MVRLQKHLLRAVFAGPQSDIIVTRAKVRIHTFVLVHQSRNLVVVLELTFLGLSALTPMVVPHVCDDQEERDVENAENNELKCDQTMAILGVWSICFDNFIKDIQVVPCSE